LCAWQGAWGASPIESAMVLICDLGYGDVVFCLSILRQVDIKQLSQSASAINQLDKIT